MMTVTRCCLCGEAITGHGHNPAPLEGGRRCDACNTEQVIPARLRRVIDRPNRGLWPLN